MNETSGILRPAVEAYLTGQPMTDGQIAAMRAYFRQWVEGFPIDAMMAELKIKVDGVVSREAISMWLYDAVELGIDPL
jgi:hypothetical protein